MKRGYRHLFVSVASFLCKWLFLTNFTQKAPDFTQIEIFKTFLYIIRLSVDTDGKGANDMKTKRETILAKGFDNYYEAIDFLQKESDNIIKGYDTASMKVEINFIVCVWVLTIMAKKN